MAVYYYYQLYIYLYVLKREVPRTVDKVALALQARTKAVVWSTKKRFGRKSRRCKPCRRRKRNGLPALCLRPWMALQETRHRLGCRKQDWGGRLDSGIKKTRGGCANHACKRRWIRPTLHASVQVTLLRLVMHGNDERVDGADAIDLQAVEAASSTLHSSERRFSGAMSAQLWTSR